MSSKPPSFDKALPLPDPAGSALDVVAESVGASQDRRRRWLLRLLLWPVLLLWTLLALAWLALHWLILPHIEEWRAPTMPAHYRAYN